MPSHGKQDNKPSPDGAVVYRAQHDIHGDEELSTSVLLALDSLPEFDMEGDQTLFDHVDLDALDNIFRPVENGTPTGQVTFTVDTYEVTTTAAGEIVIREQPDDRR